MPNGSTTKYQYDPAHRIKELTEIDPAGKIIDKLEYTYDAAGIKISLAKNHFDEESVTTINIIIEELKNYESIK